jgi:hypothetical protein
MRKRGGGRGAAVFRLESGCADGGLQPGTPYRSVKIGMAREQVWRFYGGNPNEETLIYNDNDLAHFEGDRLKWARQWSEGAKWPTLEEGLSRAKVEAIIGKPTKVCEDYRGSSSVHHLFCYVDGRVIEKSVIYGPIP